MGIYNKTHDYLKLLAIKYGGEPRPKDAPMVIGVGPKSIAGSNPIKFYNYKKLKEQPKEVADTIRIKTHNIKRNKTK